MFGFNAFFYKNRVMIENAGAYKTNEILLAYLDYEFPDLNELLTICKEYERKLHYPERGNEHLVFDKMIQSAFMFYDKLDPRTEPLRARSRRKEPCGFCGRRVAESSKTRNSEEERLLKALINVVD